jgi:hypothetical protein
VTANFSRTDAHISIQIPEHAFEWMQIPTTQNLNPCKPIEVSIPAGKGIKITLI